MERKRMGSRLLAVLFLCLAMVFIPCGQVKAEEQEEHTEGFYQYTVTDGSATIIKYLGSEKEIVTPTVLGGYPVTQIGREAFYEKDVETVTVSEGVVLIDRYAFAECRSMKAIHFPKTVQSMKLYVLLGDICLEEITVEQGNTNYYSEDGVLFKYMSDGIMLSDYPAGKNMAIYRVPKEVTEIGMESFDSTQYLKELYVPQNVSRIAHYSFSYFQNALSVYLLSDVAPHITASAFNKMPAGCHVIVKNKKVADAIEEVNIFCETPDSSVIILGEDEAYPKIPTTSLTWDGTNTTGELTLKPGEKCRLNYVQEPFNSTDNVTWSIVEEEEKSYPLTLEDENQGIIKAYGTGKCKVIGTADNGMTITLDVVVTNPVEEFYFLDFAGAEKKCSIGFGEKKYFQLNDVSSYYMESNGLSFTSSNPIVAEIEKYEDYGDYYAKVNALAPGTTTITATLDEGGKIWTDSFELTVTKSLADCTTEISNAGELVYTGEAVSTELTVMDGEIQLKEGMDYTVTAVDNVAAGTMTVTVTGKGFYTGSRTLKATIAPRSIASCTYTDREIERNCYYVPVDTDGYALTEQLQVVANGRKLVKGTDYTVAVQTRSTNAGAFADIVITGTGNYTGQLKQTVSIRPSGGQGQKEEENPDHKGEQSGEEETDGKKAQNITGVNDSYTKTYTANKKKNNFRLTAKAADRVTYASDNEKVAIVDAATGRVTIVGAGQCTITITAAGTSEYRQAVKKVMLVVRPKKAAISSVRSKKRAQLTVKWKKDSKADGYRVQYSTKKSFKKAKTITIKKKKKTAITIKKLKSKKKYYIRVCAYKKIKADKKTGRLYGTWSSRKSAKVR